MWSANNNQSLDLQALRLSGHAFIGPEATDLNGAGANAVHITARGVCSTEASAPLAG